MKKLLKISANFCNGFYNYWIHNRNYGINVEVNCNLAKDWRGYWLGMHVCLVMDKMGLFPINKHGYPYLKNLIMHYYYPKDGGFGVWHKSWFMRYSGRV